MFEWRYLALLWQFVWGFPQTIAGLAIRLTLRGKQRCYGYRSALVSEWPLDSGLALGPFVFVPQGSHPALLVHEYGHVIQSLALGPLYLPAIVLPSMMWAGLPQCQRFRDKHEYSYYRLYPERWANILAKRVTHEKPIGWYDRKR